MVEIRVLGPIRGFRDGNPLDLGGPTQRRLLASLVAEPGQVVSVTSLLEDLWGDDPPPSGPASIQSYVSRLRRVLGPDVIETTAPGYRLTGANVEVDSLEFLKLTSQLPTEPVARLQAIEAALGLWRGPAFEDFDHVDYASRRLTETRYDMEEEQAQLLAAAGHGSAALGILERVTAVEPLRESSAVTLALVLARMGRQADAVRALDRYRARLGDIGLTPGPQFTAAEVEVFEAPQVTHRSAILRATTSFVGREDEVSELEGLLEGNRLVTIVGPGGMGKTRLALEVASARAEVVFVRLESLGDDREVAATVLHAIGGETRGDPTESVIAQLSRMGTSLVVLDNVEHVIDATASLASEAVATTDVSILVTSREPLSTPGEVVMTLGPLDPNSAIELFRDRARSVDPDFDAPASTLDMLCEELDYMPLAIEMAAARSKALAPDEILARLHRRFGLFDKPLRGASERHRSLDALVDWSYGLLEPAAQRVFERLSIVDGSFDVELATAVAGFGEVPAESVTAVLANLVEKSLVARTATGAYRMLRVLKSFAGNRLESSGDEEEARSIHARWFAQLATRIGEGLSTPEETWWIDRANAAVDDLGSALDWSAKTGDLDSAQSILEGLFDWFYHRQPPAIVGWGEIVLPVADGHDALSVASAWAALAAMKRGEVAEAGRLAMKGTVVDGAAARFAWFMTGEVACYQDRLDDALDAYRKQLARASRFEDRIGVVDAMAGETLALAFQGVFDRAVDIAVDLEAIAAEIGAPTYRAHAAYALGEAVLDSDPLRSAELLERAVGLAASVNNQYIQAMARTTLGSVLARLGRFEEAKSNLHTAMEMWERMGLHAFRWTTVQYLAALLAEMGDSEPATQLLAAASRVGRRQFGAGQKHWARVVAGLEQNPEYETWLAKGRGLGLAEASDLALTATRQRR